MKNQKTIQAQLHTLFSGEGAPEQLTQNNLA